MNLQNWLHHFDPTTGEIADATVTKCHLSDLRGCFIDANSYEATLEEDDPLVYSVAGVEPADGPGDLHFGVGRLMPGRIGDEYFMTKGHLHSWREAAEIYIGLSGEGVMLLENELTGESRMLAIRPHGIVYVPGTAMHRTINTGNVPLVYLGIYPAKAGHDYGMIAARNFHNAVIERDGRPIMLERKQIHVNGRI
jgi:glucose-6-phosphate isomerase, archaeal